MLDKDCHTRFTAKQILECGYFDDIDEEYHKYVDKILEDDTLGLKNTIVNIKKFRTLDKAINKFLYRLGPLNV